MYIILLREEGEETTLYMEDLICYHKLLIIASYADRDATRRSHIINSLSATMRTQIWAHDARIARAFIDDSADSQSSRLAPDSRGIMGAQRSAMGRVLVI